MAALLMALCTSCYIGQNFFNKLFSINYKGEKRLAASAFNVIYGVVVCFVVLSVCNGFTFAASPLTIGFGIANGLVLFFYNIGITRASMSGPYAFQVVVVLSGSIVIPVFFSGFFWGDPISLLCILGIILMIIAFVVINKKGMDFTGVKKEYFLFIIIGFLANGIYGVLLDSQQRIMLHTERNEMVIVTFISSAIMSALFLFATEKSGFKDAFKMGKKSLVFLLCSSICASFAVFMMVILLNLVPNAILFPVQNGIIMAGNICLSALILREKLTFTAIAGIILIIVSIVMISV